MQKIKLNICYFDLESTGLCTNTSKILQIAAISNKNNETYQNYVMTPPELEINNSHIHHITKETLIENNAPNINTVIQSFIEWNKNIFGEEIVYLIAHNNFGYDQLLLESQFKQNGFRIPDNWRFYDSLYQFRKYNPEIGYGNYALGKMYKNYIGGELEGEFHNAITDVKALMQLHEKLTCPIFKKNSIYKDIIDQESRKATSNIDWTQTTIDKIVHNNTKVVALINRKGFKTVHDLMINYEKIHKMNASFDQYLEMMGITSRIIRQKITNQLKHIFNMSYT
jgi:DNA polymerase III alpha subunit (gram-positive type)